MNEVRTKSRFVGIREAAQMLGMSYSGVWEALRRDEFPAPAVQIGTRWRISRAALEALAGEGGERGGEE